ncbi:uncharacterized protein [Oscarella lobularis]|uniref:uncharacterized protein n=1 Tax=Oscarella lobularis TaxID=121494 RepID=UPI003313C57A
MFAFSVVGSDELASLWMATKKYRGGLGFSEKDIGLFQAVLACVTVPLQIHLTHKLENKLGSLTTFYVTCIACVHVLHGVSTCSIFHRKSYSSMDSPLHYSFHDEIIYQRRLCHDSDIYQQFCTETSSRCHQWPCRFTSGRRQATLQYIDRILPS